MHARVEIGQVQHRLPEGIDGHRPPRMTSFHELNRPARGVGTGRNARRQCQHLAIGAALRRCVKQRICGLLDDDLHRIGRCRQKIAVAIETCRDRMHPHSKVRRARNAAAHRGRLEKTSAIEKRCRPTINTPRWRTDRDLRATCSISAHHSRRYAALDRQCLTRRITRIVIRIALIMRHHGIPPRMQSAERQRRASAHDAALPQCRAAGGI